MHTPQLVITQEKARQCLNNYPFQVVKSEQLLPRLIEDMDDRDRADACGIEVLLQLCLVDLHSPELLRRIEDR